jgi:ABC-2 type transport system permease protein
MKTFFALVKRELLEHKNIWKVPLILLVIAVLLRLSLITGNLNVSIDIPSELGLEELRNSVVDSAISRMLRIMNFIVMVVMFMVAIFYALASLFNERQDESVLFWRSLPISDSMTIGSKLFVALIIIPLIIILSQALISLVFMGLGAINFFESYQLNAIQYLLTVLVWSMTPVVAWCLLCSGIAKKNPFLLAIIAPIILIVIDKLFLNGIISQHFIINRLTGIKHFDIAPLIYGLIFSGVCIAVAIIKRSQRV